MKDPALKVKVPAQLKESDRTTLTWDQLRMAPEELREMDRILLELEITDALRPGELLALRWKCLLPEDSVPAAITKAESRSKRTRPKTKLPPIGAKAEGYPAGIASQLTDIKRDVGGPDRDRTDDLFHAMENQQLTAQTAKGL